MTDSGTSTSVRNSLALWRQDLDLLWERWQPLPPVEQKWLVEDFARRAEETPGKLEGLSRLLGHDLAILESMGWLEAEAGWDDDPDLPSLAELNLPELDLLAKREGLKQLYILCQSRAEALSLEGVTL